MDSVRYLDDFFNHQISVHSTTGTDLMAKFMNLRDSEGNLYPQHWIRDILLNFALAARDTTGQLLTWSTYALASNPDMLKKAKSEVLQVVGRHRVATDDDLKKMKYMDTVLKETLRLYPSVPQTTRVVVKEDVLPDGTKVKPGDRVIYMQYHLHRNPKYWEKPDVFMPERWNNPDLLKHAFQYLPFHGGPMQCLGRHMAHIEAKILLIRILQQFVFQLEMGKPVIPRLGVTLSAQEGIHIRYSTRKIK